MKRLSILLIAALFVMIGCSDESGIVGPEQPTKNLQWLSMKPAHSGAGIESIATTSFTETIEGNKGGKIKFNFNFADFGGEDVEVKGKLKIPKDAFVGVMDITIEFNDASPSVVLSPSGVTFDEELELDIKYKNLNLDGLTENDEIGFAYIAANGETVMTEYQSLNVNLNKNKVKVVQAEIPHFSRFGFVKVDD